jgi:hypothetical protein
MFNGFVCSVNKKIMVDHANEVRAEGNKNAV